MKAGNLKIRWRHKNLMGAFTECAVWSPISEKPIVGTAWLNPRDHFCKEIGRKLSLARAMKNANLLKEERRVVWELYRNMKPSKRW